MTLLQTVSRLLILPTLLIAAAVVVRGGTETGDAFSGGVTAGLAVALVVLPFGYERLENTLVVRRAELLLPIGVGLVAVVTFVPVLFGDPVMTHVPPSGTEAVRFGSIELRTQFLFEIGVFLAVFAFLTEVVGVVARDVEGEES